MPVYWTEEGRYLADALGEPLIKGLTEVANKRPQDPVFYLASYLYNYANHDRKADALPQYEEALAESTHLKPGSSTLPRHRPPGLTDHAALLASQLPHAALVGSQLPHAALVGSQAPLVGSQAPHVPTRGSSVPESRPAQLVDELDDPDIRDVEELEEGEEGEEKRLTPSPETAFSNTSRDEHGQSMLHFAAARAHGRNALFELLQETEINIGYRDELYRTARDVAVVANLPENVKDIDKWVLHLTANGETEKLGELLLEGYTHIIPEEDGDDPSNIVQIALERSHQETATFLQSLPSFEESRDQIHVAVREGDLQAVQEMLSEDPGAGRLLAVGKNSFGRCSLHLAVLQQNEEMTEYISNSFPETLRVGDNLERTPLHYAMGVEKVEDLSTILIQAGAKRVLKDLKGRQPSYYFMNKTDILRLQSEEEESML